MGDACPWIQSSIGMHAVRCWSPIAKGKNVVGPTVPRYAKARTLSKHAVKRTADAHPPRTWNAARVVASGAMASTTRARAGRSTGAFFTNGQSGRVVGPIPLVLRTLPSTRGPIWMSLLPTLILIGADPSARDRQSLRCASGGASADGSAVPTVAYAEATRTSAESPAVSKMRV